MINTYYAQSFCTDYTKIENYECAILDTSQTWCCHHRNEIELNVSRQQLIDMNLYFHRPPEELIFLTSAEHNRIHHKGKTISLAHRQAISKANTGKNNPMYGKPLTNILPPEKISSWKLHLSQAGKGRPKSEETKKKMSEAAKRKWKVRKQLVKL